MRNYNINNNDNQKQNSIEEGIQIEYIDNENDETKILDENVNRNNNPNKTLIKFVNELDNKENLIDNVDHKQEIKYLNLRKKRKSKQTNLDYILSLIGSFGLFQKLQFILVGFLSVVPSMVAYSYVFVAATPKYTCKVAVETKINNYDSIINDLSDHQQYIKELIRVIHLDYKINDTIIFNNKCNLPGSNEPFMDSDTKFDISSKKYVKCLEWVYDKSLYGSTISTEWDLICSRSYLKAATQNAYIIGTAGSIISGIMSDKIGRKRTVVILIILMALILNVTQLLMQTPIISKNAKLTIFTISRLFQGFAQTMYSISFVLLMEITGPSNRVLAGNIMAYSFAIGQMILVGLAYYVRDWNKIMWFLSFYILPFLSLFWLVPESPRWLLNKNRVNEARIVIKKIASLNNKYNQFMITLHKFFFNKTENVNMKFHLNNYLKNEETSSYIVSLLHEEANKFKNNKKNQQTYRKTLVAIKNTKKLSKRCLILFYIWMIILMVYLGMGMGMSNVMDKHVDPYFMFLKQAIFEFFGVVTCHLILNRLGRKIPLIIFMISASTVIFLIPFFYEKFPIVSVIFYLIAKYSISAAQLTCMIYTSELYPTSMRGTGVGLSVSIARIGGVWAPQINVLGGRFGFYVPYVIFSSLALFAAFAGFFLPETLNKNLPESVSEADKMGEPAKSFYTNNDTKSTIK